MAWLNDPLDPDLWWLKKFVFQTLHSLCDLDSQPKQICYVIYAEHLPPTFYYENSKHRENEAAMSSGSCVTTTWSPQWPFHLIRFNTGRPPLSSLLTNHSNWWFISPSSSCCWFQFRMPQTLWQTREELGTLAPCGHADGSGLTSPLCQPSLPQGPTQFPMTC